MALDEALMGTVRAGGRPILRLYRWAPACLSLGRNQPAEGGYDRERLAHAGIDLVRRPTGGRAVLHDDELTYAALLPDRALGSARRAQRAIQHALLAALAQLGVRAALHAADAPAPALSTTPCFAEPTEGEVVAEGRKVIGSAQLRVGGVLLQHGSLPLQRSREVRHLPADLQSLVDGAPAYLEELLARPVGWDEVAGAIATAWRDNIGPLEPGSITPAESDVAERLRTKYDSAEWTWRC